MNRDGDGTNSITGSRSAGLASRLHQVLFILFLAQFALAWIRLWPGRGALADARWPEGLLLVLACATLLSSLSLQLPAQNVLLAATVVGAIAGAVTTLGALSGIPFGPFVYTENIGPRLFHPLPWAVPFMWLTIILAARGVARLILRPWRKTRTYGFRLIGITVALVVLMDVALEPFAMQVRHYWIWAPTKLNLHWHTAPVINFVGWAVTALLILVFATPAMVNKHPRPPSQPHYTPLTLWLLLHFLFATGAALHQLWLAALVITFSGVAVATFALRGARW